MSEPTTAKSWKTCDIKTVAFLIYAGFPIRNVSRDGNRAVFAFDDSSERSSAVLAFQNKQQCVEPVAFIGCQNQARDMVSQVVKT